MLRKELVRTRPQTATSSAAKGWNAFISITTIIVTSFSNLIARLARTEASLAFIESGQKCATPRPGNEHSGDRGKTAGETGGSRSERGTSAPKVRHRLASEARQDGGVTRHGASLRRNPSTEKTEKRQLGLSFARILQIPSFAMTFCAWGVPAK